MTKRSRFVPDLRPFARDCALARMGDTDSVRRVLKAASESLRAREAMPATIADYLAESLEAIAEGSDPTTALKMDNPPHRPGGTRNLSERQAIAYEMSAMLATNALLVHLKPGEHRALSKRRAAEALIRKYSLPYTLRTLENWHREFCEKSP